MNEFGRFLKSKGSTFINLLKYEVFNDLDILYELCGFRLDLIDLSLIDGILISDVHCALGLPFVFEFGFNGKFVISKATLSLLKLAIKEFRNFLESKVNLFENISENSNQTFTSKISKIINKIYDIYNDENLYKIINHSIEINHGEIKQFDSLLKFTGFSSGVFLGTSNWLLEFGSLKISVFSQSSLESIHSTPFDASSLLNSKIAIKMFESLDSSTISHSNFNSFALDLNNIVIRSFQSNHDIVIIPTNSSYHIILNIIESFALYNNHNWIKNNINNDHSNENYYQDINSICSQIKILLISNTANEFLNLICNLPEWISPKKYQQIHFGSESCFEFNKMLQSGQLKCFTNLTQIEKIDKYSIVIAPHLCLKFGPIVDIIKLFSKKSKIIFTDPFFKELSIQTLKKEVFYYQNINFTECYLKSTMNQSEFNLMLKSLNITNFVTLNPGKIISIKIRDNSLRVFQTSQSISKINNNIMSIQGDVLQTTRKLIIDIQNNEFEASHQLVTFGQIFAHDILESLVKCGFTNLRCEHVESWPPSSIIIYTDNDELLINVDQNSIHIISSSNIESLQRAKLAICQVCNKI